MRTRKQRDRLTSTQKGEYAFDAAISVAGEDREYAEELESSLTKLGFRVFYDVSHRGHLWGRGQKEYERIYGPASRFMIPFISKDYAKKEWTIFEFETAKREARRRKTEFILPIRIDDTRLLGLSDDCNYLDLRKISIGEVSVAFADKLSSVEHTPGIPRGVEKKRKALLLNHDCRTALGLMATSFVPLRRKHLRDIFPAIEWARHLRTLQEHGLVRTRREPLHVTADAKRTLLRGESEVRKLNERWIEALEPFKEHPDIALFLALHYIGLGRREDALLVLLDVAEAMEPGMWTSTYVHCLQSFLEASDARRYGKRTRIRLYNALGLCLSHDLQHNEALTVFDKLHRYARRIGDEWGQTQYYLNAGAVCANLGNVRRAMRLYEKVIQIARRADDYLVLARSLSNLAQLISQDDPERADVMLTESLHLKRDLGDDCGVATTQMAEGVLAAQRGDPCRAAKLFRKVVASAKALGARHLQATALHNLGVSNREIGHDKYALNYFNQARQLAEEEGFRDVRTLAMAGQAQVLFERGHYADTERVTSDLFASAKKLGDVTTMLLALHGKGISQLFQGRSHDGKKTLSKAIALARKDGDEEWLRRCLIDRSRCIMDDELGLPEARILRRDASFERTAGRLQVAGDLWTSLLDVHVQVGKPRADAEAAAEQAIACFVKDGRSECKIAEVYRELFLLRWQAKDYESALDALSNMDAYAHRGESKADRIAALDQRGVCLQELGRDREAIPFHKKAIGFARKQRLSAQLATSLNNLGEAFRRIGRVTAAITAFEESEMITTDSGDISAQIATAHNRALALQAQDAAASAEVLQWCRQQAERRGLWDEYVRAWEALANLAWSQGRKGLALRRYQRALNEAKIRKRPDSKAGIALNYASLLESMGRTATALRVLRPYEKRFEGETNAFLFHATLAQLLSDKKDYKTAEEQWTKGLQAAEMIGNDEYVTICSVGLADLYKAKEQPRRSLNHLRRALSLEKEPTERLILLTQLLQVAIDSGNDAEVERAFNEAREQAESQDVKEAYVDIHIWVADHLWDKGAGYRFEATKAYTVAFASALRISEDACSEIASHIIVRLTNQRHAPSSRQLDSLIRSLMKWLPSNDSETENVCSFACSPFVVLRRLLPFIGKPKQMARELTRIARSDDWLLQE